MKEILFGYETNSADKINGGNFFGGDEFSLSNIVTPIFND